MARKVIQIEVVSLINSLGEFGSPTDKEIDELAVSLRKLLDSDQAYKILQTKAGGAVDVGNVKVKSVFPDHCIDCDGSDSNCPCMDGERDA